MEKVNVHLSMESASATATSSEAPERHDRLNDALHRFVELMLKHSCLKFVGFCSAPNWRRASNRYWVPLCRHAE